LEKRIASRRTQSIQGTKSVFARSVALISKKNMSIVPFLVANADVLKLSCFFIFLSPGQAGMAKKLTRSYDNIQYFGGVVAGWPEAFAVVGICLDRCLQRTREDDQNKHGAIHRMKTPDSFFGVMDSANRGFMWNHPLEDDRVKRNDFDQMLTPENFLIAMDAARQAGMLNGLFQ